MATQPRNITSLPRSPDDDRHSRMVKYSVLMAIRLVCIGLCVVVHGWWLLVCVAGAVILPYVAVILANAVDSRTLGVERPGTVVRADTDSDNPAEPHDQSEPRQ